MKRIILILMFVMLAVSYRPGPVLAARDVVLTWEAPTTHTDGSPFTDVLGYEVQYGNAPGVYDTAVIVGNVLTWTINLPAGDWYFVVRVRATTGMWSDFSNECHKKIDLPKPGAPGLSCGF